MMYTKFYVRDIFKYFCNNECSKMVTLNDYLNTQPNFSTPSENGFETIDMSLANYLNLLCNKMVEDGLMITLQKNYRICLPNSYLSMPDGAFSNPAEFHFEMDYGCYDFKYQGFQFMRHHLANSVVPIVGKNSRGNEDIGTAFYIGNRQFVTAAHCVKDLNEFNLLDSKENSIPIKHVLFAKDHNPDIYDVAIIEVGQDIGLKPLILGIPELMSSVLVMGFPPIPGLNPVQTVESASIGAFLRQKSSEGEIVGETASYMTGMDYFLINARVKGGNSGGPVIDEYGKVVGVVVQIPLDSAGGYDTGRYDLMGYGICLPSKYVTDLLNNPDIKEVKILQNGRYSII